MNNLRLQSLLLSLVLIFNLISVPFAQAASNETPTVGSISSLNSDNLIIQNNNAVLSFQNTDYLWNLYVDTHTGSGSFAIRYSSNPEYMYDYSFTIDSANIHTDSLTFWNEVLSDCLDAKGRGNTF